MSYHPSAARFTDLMLTIAHVGSPQTRDLADSSADPNSPNSSPFYPFHTRSHLDFSDRESVLSRTIYLRPITMRDSTAATLIVAAILLGATVVSVSRESSSAANPNHRSSSLGSSVSSGSTIQSTVAPMSTGQSASTSTIQSTVESSAQYPLVWAPNSPVKWCDTNCLELTLAFSGQDLGNASPITIIPNEGSNYTVTATAFYQDVATDQNVTTSSLCHIPRTGYTYCDIASFAGMPSGTYQVTVFITKDYLPCSLHEPPSPYAAQLLAPPLTTTMTE